jgi:hypothetical protein
MKLLNKIIRHFYGRFFFVLLIYPLALPIIILAFRPDLDFKYFFLNKTILITNSIDIKDKIESGIQLKIKATPDPDTIYIYSKDLINPNYNLMFRLKNYPDNFICLIQNDDDIKNLISNINNINDNTSDRIKKILSHGEIDPNIRSKILTLLNKDLDLSGRIYSRNDCNNTIKNILSLCDFYNFNDKDLVNLNNYYISIKEKNTDKNVYLLVNSTNPDIDTLIGSSLFAFSFLTFASFIIIYALSYHYIFKFPPLINYIRKSQFNKALEIIHNYSTDINITDKLGNNALIWSVSKKNFNITYGLIERGIDTNKKGYKNITPLTAAVLNKDYKIIELLLNKKASPDTIIDGNFTILHYAVFKNDLKLISLLLSHQVQIDKADNNNQTPFILAIIRKEFEIIKMFFETKPDVLAKKYNGKSIYDIAIDTNDNLIINIFNKYILENK